MWRKCRKRKISFFDQNICAFLVDGNVNFYFKSDYSSYNIVPLIIDGSVNDLGFSFINKNPDVLEKYFTDNDLSYNNILFAFYYCSKIYVIKK